MTCPICNESSKILFKRQNQLASVRMKSTNKKELIIAACKKCNFIWNYNAFKNPKEFDEWISSAYKNYQLLDNNLHSFPLIDERAKLAKNFIEKNCNFKDFENIVEIGSNRGDFLAYLQQSYPNKHFIGIESSHLSKVGIPTIFNNVMDINFSSSFDLIIIRQVLEHIASPETFLTHLKSFMKQDGYICIEVPNLENDLNENIEPWIVEHVSYFCVSSLSTLCKKMGFEIININQEEQLLILLKNTNQISSVETSIYNKSLFNLIELSNNNILNVQKQWLDNYLNDSILCFYGASNVFLAISGVLEYLWDNNWNQDKNKILIDDYINKKGTIINNLQVETLETFTPTKKCVYIICAMNRDHHKNMLKNLEKKLTKNDEVYIMWTRIK